MANAYVGIARIFVLFCLRILLVFHENACWHVRHVPGPAFSVLFWRVDVDGKARISATEYIHFIISRLYAFSLPNSF